MTNLINGRTPEEIKQELQWLAHGCPESEPECDECVHAKICSNLTERDAPCNALALIEHLEARQPKWISVEERLPEEAGKYIVCTRKKAVYCTAFRFFHGKGYFATDLNTHITHWMPLPEPPKEENV